MGNMKTKTGDIDRYTAPLELNPFLFICFVGGGGNINPMLRCGEISLWRIPVSSDNTHSTSQEGQAHFFPDNSSSTFSAFLFRESRVAISLPCPGVYSKLKV